MRRRRVTALAAGLSVAALVGGGCSNTAPSANADVNGVPADLGEFMDLRGRQEVTIEVPDNVYKPRAFKVSPGTKITFRNTGANVHNVTPNEEEVFEPVSFTSGESAAIVAPQNPKAYRFYCTLHGSRTGGQRGAFLVAGPT